jgi:hypothetical protein
MPRPKAARPHLAPLQFPVQDVVQVVELSQAMSTRQRAWPSHPGTFGGVMPVTYYCPLAASMRAPRIMIPV